MTAAITRYRSLPREADMERTIREAVEYRGGRVWSVRDSRGLAIEDMPDLIIVLPPVVALIELKSQRRRITPGQAHVTDLLATCTDLVTGIVRPIPKPGELSQDDLLAILTGGR